MCVCCFVYIFSLIFTLTRQTASFYFFFSMRLSSDYTTERIFSGDWFPLYNLGSSPLLETRCCCTHTHTLQRAKNGCIRAQKTKKRKKKMSDGEYTSTVEPISSVASRRL